MEEYKRQADLVIEESEKRNVILKEEINAQKRQRNIIAPIVAGLLGIAAGIIYQQQQ